MIVIWGNLEKEIDRIDKILELKLYFIIIRIYLKTLFGNNEI